MASVCKHPPPHTLVHTVPCLSVGPLPDRLAACCLLPEPCPASPHLPAPLPAAPDSDDCRHLHGTLPHPLLVRAVLPRRTAAFYCCLLCTAMHLLQALGLLLARHAACQGPCQLAGGAGSPLLCCTVKHDNTSSLPVCRRYIGQHSCVSYLATWLGLTPVEVRSGLRCSPPCQRALPWSLL